MREGEVGLAPSPAHFMHFPTSLAYNGAKPTIDAFQTPTCTQHLPTLDRKEIPTKLEPNTRKS